MQLMTNKNTYFCSKNIRMNLFGIDFGHIPLLLAPMEGVTDAPFRHVCKEFGADIVYSEFISSDGLIRDAVKSIRKLSYTEAERPFGVQIFGNAVGPMVEAASYAERYKPDIIDINFGCPAKKVASKGAGSGMMNNIPKMVEITAAVVKAVSTPVTVKTRLGYDDEHREIVDIAERLQDVGISALTIHGRLRTTKWSQPADWTLIGAVKNNQRMHIPIIGNGDIIDGLSARKMIDETGVDAIMIGRATYGNPWIFREIKSFLETNTVIDKPDIQERVRVATNHLHDALNYKEEHRAVFEMRKHWGNYFKGIPNFKPFRLKLVSTETVAETDAVLKEIAATYDS